MTPVNFKVFLGKSQRKSFYDASKLYSIYIQESPARGLYKVNLLFYLGWERSVPLRTKISPLLTIYICREWKVEIRLRDTKIPSSILLNMSRTYSSIPHVENMFECSWKHANHIKCTQEYTKWIFKIVLLAYKRETRDLLPQDKIYWFGSIFNKKFLTSLQQFE